MNATKLRQTMGRAGVTSREIASLLRVGSRLVRYWTDPERPETPSHAQSVAIQLYCEKHAGRRTAEQYKRDPVARR